MYGAWHTYKPAVVDPTLQRNHLKLPNFVPLKLSFTAFMSFISFIHSEGASGTAKLDNFSRLAEKIKNKGCYCLNISCRLKKIFMLLETISPSPLPSPLSGYRPDPVPVPAPLLLQLHICFSTNKGLGLHKSSKESIENSLTSLTIEYFTCYMSHVLHII